MIKEHNGEKYSLKPFEGYKFRMKFVVRKNDGTNLFNNDIYTTNLDKKEVEKLFKMKARSLWNAENTEVTVWKSKEQDELDSQFLDEILKDL